MKIIFSFLYKPDVIFRIRLVNIGIKLKTKLTGFDQIDLISPFLFLRFKPNELIYFHVNTPSDNFNRNIFLLEHIDY